MLSRRRSGILLHPTSLPSPYGIGDLGDSAYRFVDFLVAAGQTVWQMLPLGPTGFGDSPYSSYSAFAGNPLLISPLRLVEAGDLTVVEIADKYPGAAGVADYGYAGDCKGKMLRRAAERFFAAASAERREAFTVFRAVEAFWLEDYALFRALRRHFGECHWRDWPTQLRDREEGALDVVREELAGEVQLECYIQFVFHEQWSQLQHYARQNGIALFGDIPIFVADDSADVWARRDLFQLDGAGLPIRVAGVPPDYFSATGQRWGNPLYRWDRLQETGFSWWIARLRRNLDLYDLIRIDHFRGFSACWSIAAEEPTAVHGHWEPAPGEALFAAAEAALGPLPVIAEDLGVITPDVESLRERFGFPGMKILQFAFGGGSDNPYLPHNYTTNCVAYSGTHDNETTVGWWHGLPASERRAVERYCGRVIEAPALELIRLASASVADLCIFPVQDVLGLGADARFNSPGEAAGNWRWRLDAAQSLDDAARQLSAITECYGRLVRR